MKLRQPSQYISSPSTILQGFSLQIKLFLQVVFLVTGAIKAVILTDFNILRWLVCAKRFLKPPRIS